MNITEQNILGIDSHTTDLQTLSCGHQIREVKGIKSFLSEDCRLCFEPLIGDRKLCIYNCGHMMHVDCLISSQKVDASRDTCLACINKITSMAIYENSKKLEECELYTCIDDKCNERRKQEIMVPFFLIKDYFTHQNQIVQNQTVQNQTVQNQTVQNQTVQNQTVQNQTVQNQNLLLEIYQNIAPTLNDDEKIRLLEIVTSSSLTTSEKQLQIVNFLTGVGIPLNLNSILIKDNRLLETNSVIPDINVNTSRSTSNTVMGNINTVAITSEPTTRYNATQQPSTSYVRDYSNDSITTLRSSSLATNESHDLIMEGRRVSFFSRIKKIILCRK